MASQRRPRTVAGSARAAAYRAIREADWDELRARYEAGASTADLAVELDLAQKTVQNQLRLHGTRMRTGTIPARLPVSDTDLRAAYTAGATLTELAEKHRCSVSLIWRRINFDSCGDPHRVGDGVTVAPMVFRTLDGQLPIGPICAAYRGGATLVELAARWQCSMSGIRSVLRRGEVVMRPRRGRAPVEDGLIVELRDRRRLSWAEIANRTGLTEEALLARYKDAQGGRPAREWHRHQSTRPDLTAAQLTDLNSVVDRRPDIVNAYLTGQASAMQLGRDHGISDTTVRRWAKADRTTG